MTRHQVSVFIQNEAGSLEQVFQLLKKENIQLIVSTVSDTIDCGVCRIICDNPVKAVDALKKAGMAASLTDVFVLELDDVPGTAADTISTFAAAGISIAYLYSFLYGGKGILVFRTSDRDKEKAASIISGNGFKTFTM